MTEAALALALARCSAPSDGGATGAAAAAGVPAAGGRARGAARGQHELPLLERLGGGPGCDVFRSQLCTAAAVVKVGAGSRARAVWVARRAL